MVHRLMVTLTTDPVVPWSTPIVGPIILTATALAIAGMTFWTYRGAALPPWRKATIIAVRLLALLIAVFTVVRPSLAIRDDERLPSKLIIALDTSKSMTVTDEVNSKSRWEAAERMFRDSTQMLRKLRDEHNVTVELHRFADELNDPPDDVQNGSRMAELFAKPPAGSRTDFGQMLRAIAQKYGQERALRGLLILSDGADNGTRFPAIAEASKFRALSCPVQTFSLGQESTSSQQHDVAILSAAADPSPVPVKGKVTVHVNVDSPGYENAKTTLRLFFDGKEVASNEVQFRKAEGNELTIDATAPATAGEIKLSVKIDPLPGEASLLNNDLTTYLTVSREGLSVLIIDRLRPELQHIRRALAGDPRMRVFQALRQTDEPLSGADATLYDFSRQAYDVIIIGDVPAHRVAAGNGDVLRQIEQLVSTKGVGLLMIGGHESFAAGGWMNTKVADALPVLMDVAGEFEEPVRMQPAKSARNEYIMRIGPDPAASEMLWKKLPALPGFSKLGKRKASAVVVGESATGVPLLVRQDYGRGRTAALALDETRLWYLLGPNQRPRTTEGQDAHARFWRQLILYLAHQEETEGSVWIKPEVRRVPVGTKVPFGVGVRGKTGIDLPNANFEVKAVHPDGKSAEPVTVARDKESDRGTFWKTDQPGEYQLQVKATAKDVDGTPVSDEAKARFLVYQDDTELLRPAADHQFLARIAAAGDGRAYVAEDLPKFLADLPSQPLPNGGAKVTYIPDWRSNHLGPFPPLLYGVFVVLLGLEWGLRRFWGLV
ncbi:MAG: glutamine amidotransferase [Gemmataceae bacterium]